MADTTHPGASPPASGAIPPVDIARAEKFAREAFVHEGEEADVVLA